MFSFNIKNKEDEYQGCQHIKNGIKHGRKLQDIKVSEAYINYGKGDSCVQPEPKTQVDHEFSHIHWRNDAQ